MCCIVHVSQLIRRQHTSRAVPQAGLSLPLPPFLAPSVQPEEAGFLPHPTKEQRQDCSYAGRRRRGGRRGGRASLYSPSARFQMLHRLSHTRTSFPPLTLLPQPPSLSTNLSLSVSFFHCLLCSAEAAVQGSVRSTAARHRQPAVSGADPAAGIRSPLPITLFQPALSNIPLLAPGGVHTAQVGQ